VATVFIVGCSGSDEPASLTTSIPPVTARPNRVDLAAEYSCGPEDGTAVEAQVEALDGPATVTVALEVDGEVLGTSERVAIEEGAPREVLFGVQLRDGDYGRTGTIVVHSMEPEAVMATADLLLEHPPGGGCG
jgi:hypothetical protein